MQEPETKMFVAAIDFGTTYSGYAFSFRHDFEDDPTKVSSNNWNASSAGLISLKTPTTLLLNDKEEFVAFGYDAENQFTDLAEEEEHGKYFYFRRFKMMLFDKIHRLTRQTMLKDITGKELPAIDVFAHGIRFLKKHMMETLEKRATGVKDKDIQWVLTVPAIWDDPAKQFMREAAEKADIKGDQLMIALEPEAASLFCKFLPIDKFCGEENSINAFSPGCKYLVLDAGGGTVDITVHQVQGDGTLKELDKASGGSWGGTKVDQAFKDMLGSIIGPTSIEEFSLTNTADYIEIFREFEIKKRSLKDDLKKVTMKIPLSLDPEENMREMTKKSDFKHDIEWTGDKMRIKNQCFKRFFDEVSKAIVEHVKDLLQSKNVKGTKNILMVGGFSESPILQETIRAEFPDCRVIIPQDAGLAVLKGAVIFGHKPNMIASRIAKYTYGVETTRKFDSSRHPNSKKKMIEGKEKCTGLFDRHVQRGQMLNIDEAQREEEYYPLYSDQKRVTFPIYTSSEDGPEFTDDYSCHYLGKMTVDLPKNLTKSQKAVDVGLVFGGTELTVRGKVKATNEIVTAKFDFLDGEP